MIRAGQDHGQRSDCGGGEALWACFSGEKSGADSGKGGARGGGHDSQWRSVAQGWRSSMRGPE